MKTEKMRGIIILISEVALGLLLLVGTYFLKNDGNRVVIKKVGKVVGEYSLNVDTTVNLETNKLIIKNGKAYMESANCPDKICVAHAPISKTGETIVCLPNKIIAEIR